MSEKSEFIEMASATLQNLFMEALDREETAELMFEVMKHQVSLTMLLPEPKKALTTFTNGMHDMLETCIEADATEEVKA